MLNWVRDADRRAAVDRPWRRIARGLLWTCHTVAVVVAATHPDRASRNMIGATAAALTHALMATVGYCVDLVVERGQQQEPRATYVNRCVVGAGRNPHGHQADGHNNPWAPLIGKAHLRSSPPRLRSGFTQAARLGSTAAQRWLSCALTPIQPQVRVESAADARRIRAFRQRVSVLNRR